MAAREPAAGSDEERDLVEAAQRDPARFSDLYEIHFERVYGYIARRVRARDIAEDLTSEVFHKALASMPGYTWTGAPFIAWLIRIAANAVADQMKRAAREASAEEEPVDSGAAADLEALEHRGRLFRCVEQLPDDQRLVIIERFVEQRSIREVAQQLSRSEGAVKQLQLRALESLRQKMEGRHA